MMADEHISRILKMLEEGKISAKEAETLIAALKPKVQADRGGETAADQSSQGRRADKAEAQPAGGTKSFEFSWGHRKAFPLDLSALGRQISAVVNRMDPDRMLRDARVGGRRWQERMREWARAWQAGEDTPPVNPLGLPTSRTVETRTIELDAPALVEVINPGGYVRVVGGGQGVSIEVQKEAWADTEIEAASRLETATVETEVIASTTGPGHGMADGEVRGERDAPHLLVRAILPDDWRDGLVNLSLRVPDQTSVRVATLFGEVHVESVLGTVEAQSTSGSVVLSGIGDAARVEVVSGSIRASEIGGSLRATAKSGDISCEGLKHGATVASVGGDITLRRVEGGRLEAKSVSGDVVGEDVGAQAPLDIAIETVSGDSRLIRAYGNIAIKTVSGDARAEQVDVASLSAQAVSGDLDIRIASEFVGAIQADTVTGDVRLALPSAGNFRYTLVTRSGDLSCDHPATDALRSDTVLSGTVGTGAGSINAKTLSGDITLTHAESVHS